MSTRSVIGRKTESGFTGVYHHWDGYPQGLGATLFEKRRTQFNGNTEKMLKHLIDDHPAGWSTFNGDEPQCYCHWKGREEKASSITEANAAECGCEWAYVFDPDGQQHDTDGLKMEIYSSHHKDGGKMIGMFGCGDPESIWVKVATINLDGEEPDWKMIG